MSGYAMERCHEHDRPMPCVPCLKRDLAQAGEQIDLLESQRAALLEACEDAVSLIGAGDAHTAHARLSDAITEAKQ